MYKVRETLENVYCVNTANYYNEAVLANNRNIVLLSGGIDSQALVSYLKHKNYKYETIFADYKFNYHDGEFVYDPTHVLHLDLDTLYFDEKIHLKYFEEYKCTSPQYAIHLHILDYVRKNFNGYNILMPGTPELSLKKRLDKIVNNWVNYTGLVYQRYKKKNKLTNFYPYFFNEFSIAKKINSCTIHQKNNCNLYTKKFLLYENLGLDIIQQDLSYTGFEHYRIYLKEKGIIYDANFRKPIDIQKPVIYFNFIERY